MIESAIQHVGRYADSLGEHAQLLRNGAHMHQWVLVDSFSIVTAWVIFARCGADDEFAEINTEIFNRVAKLSDNTELPAIVVLDHGGTTRWWRIMRDEAMLAVNEQGTLCTFVPLSRFREVI